MISFRCVIKAVSRPDTSSALDGKPDCASEACRPITKVTFLEAHRHHSWSRHVQRTNNHGSSWIGGRRRPVRTEDFLDNSSQNAEQSLRFLEQHDPGPRMRMNRTHVFLAFLVITVNAVPLMAVLHSPYLGDDSWRESTLRGIAQLTGTGLVRLSWDTVQDFMRSGRWYPLVIYYYPIFFSLDQFQYKLLVVCMVMANVVVFGWLVRIITASAAWGLAGMALSPFVVQLRFYHDPVLSYYCLMQVEFAFLALSTGLFVRYVREGGRGTLAASIACYTACLLVYEAFYLFWIVHLVVARVHFGRDRLRVVVRTSAPFFLVTVVNALIAVYLRITNTVYYEGVDARFAPADWIRTVAEQVFSAVPFSYAVASDAIRTARQAAGASEWSVVLVGILWAGVWWLLWTSLDGGLRDSGSVGGTCGMRDESLPPAQLGTSARMLLLIGLAFWVLPAPIVALSGKYQRELTWGLGYLPAYVSAFGVIMLALVGLRTCVARARGTGALFSTIAVLGFALAGGTLYGVNYANNWAVVDQYNLVEHRPRRLIEDALDAGLLKPVADRSVLVCDEPLRGWENPAFFRQHTGLNLQVVKQPGFWFDCELGNTTISEALGGFERLAPETYELRAPENRDRVFAGYQVRFEGRGWPLLSPVTAAPTGADPRRVFLLSYRTGKDGSAAAILAQLTSLKADQDRLVAASADRMWVYVARPEDRVGEGTRITGRWSDGTLTDFGFFAFDERDLELIASHRAGRLFLVPDGLMEHAVDPRSIEAR